MPSAQPEGVNRPAEPFSTLIGKLAGTIGSDGFPAGDRAMLKRMDREEAPPLAFYRFAFRHLPETWPASRAAWSAVLQGMALMSPNIHRPDLAFGRVLAEQDYSEARLERLLSASGEVENILALRAIRFLAAKKVPIDWRDVARLLLARDRQKRHEIHMKIASDFYRSLKSKE